MRSIAYWLAKLCSGKIAEKTRATIMQSAKSVPIMAMMITAITGCAGSGPVPETPPLHAESARPAAEANATAYYAMCGGEARSLEEILQPIVTDLSMQNIPYAREPANEWRDCSGNFLRLSSNVASACPEQHANLLAPPGVKAYRAGTDNAVAFNVPYRSSRSVAQWYHERGRFVPVYYDDVTSLSGIPADLYKYRNLIRPGAVLWFSRGKPTAAGDGLNALFNKTGSGSHINHMGTVTSVRRNENGEVIGFDMYHGHGTAAKGTPASVTRKQYWEWPAELLDGGSKEYPPMGYWSQRLVGIGTLLPVVNLP